MTFFGILVAATLGATARPVAHVGTTDITTAPLAARMRAYRASARPVTPKQILDGLIDEALLAEEAQRRGLAKDPGVEQIVQAETRRRAAEIMFDEQIVASTKVPEETLRAMYHETADSIRLSLLVYASREEAQAGHDRLAGGAAFADEAKRSIDTRAAERSGDTGILLRGQVDPAVAAVAFATPDGKLFGPVQGQVGWAVGKVIERQIGDEPGFTARRDGIAKHARQRFAEEGQRHFAEQLRKSASARIDEEFLRALGHRSDPTPQEAQHVVATFGGKQLRYAEVYPEIMRFTSGASGHMFGASVKLQVISQLVDERLLEDAAMSRGFGSGAHIQAELPYIRRAALALLVAEKIRQETPGPGKHEIDVVYERLRKAQPGAGVTRDQVAARLHFELQSAALANRVRALRAATTIQIDEAALAEAAGS